MAKPHICHSPCYNHFLDNEDEPVGGSPGTSTKGNNTPIPFPAVFQPQILTPAPSLAPSSTKELCQ